MSREHIGNLIWGEGGGEIDLHFIYTPDIIGGKKKNKNKKSANALGCSTTLQ
jgi:hypothetical protein